MLSYTTWLVSKMDLVKYIFEKTALKGLIAWWQVLLSEFDIVYVTQKAVKGSALANYLTQHDVAPCGACRPWILFINGFLFFLRSNCNGMEKEKDEWRHHFK